MKSERFEFDGKVYWIETPTDTAIRKDKIQRHTPGLVWHYPTWYPWNWWRNHFCQRSAMKRRAWEAYQEENNMNEYLLDCAIARLEEDIK